MPKAIVWGSVIAAALALTSPTRVTACSCAAVPLETEIEYAGAIFTATVLDTARTHLSPGPYWQMTVQVSQYWKGVIVDPMVIYTAENEAVCGRLMLPGEEYLFFVYGNPGSYATSLCSNWTMPVSAAAEVIAQLGPPLPVQTSTSTWGRIKTLYR